MFNRFRSWHSGLSKVGKAFLWSITAVLAGSVIASAANQPQTTKTDNSPGQVQAPETKKEPKVTKKTVTETTEVDFEKTTVNDSSLDKGKSEVRISGVKGVKTFTYEITLEDGQEKDKKLVKEEVTTAPITEVTAIGIKVAYVAPKPTSNCDPNYTPCIQYVAGNTLNCPDIHVMVHVIGTDHNKFDGDGDGYGCESYN